MRYADATAFRQALADRLRRQYPEQDVGRLQKRAVMERFLARLVVELPERARLKGGYALELRLDRARATQDIDLALREVSRDEALETLRDAAELDLDDHPSYRVETTTRGVPQAAPYGGDRLTVVPELGGEGQVWFGSAPSASVASFPPVRPAGPEPPYRRAAPRTPRSPRCGG